MWSRLGQPFLFAAFLVGLLAGLAGSAAARPPEQVTARLGISAGEAIADLPLGAAGSTLEPRIGILFETAARLGVRVETVSVGQGFFSDDGELLSERDLDLVVTGSRDDVVVLGATLGRAWEQSSVFVWYVGGGPMATATIPLPGGADALTDEIYQALVGELAGGGHVRYAGADSLLFVANIGEEPDVAFFARMERVRELLEQAGVRADPVQQGWAEMVALERDDYEDHIERRGLERAA
jgi:hypothetical protein